MDNRSPNLGGDVATPTSSFRSDKGLEYSETLERCIAQLQLEMKKLQDQVHKQRSDFDQLMGALSGIPAFKNLHKSDPAFVEPPAKLTRDELRVEMEDLKRQTCFDHQLTDIGDVLRYSEPEGFCEILLSKAVNLVKGSFLLELFQRGDRIERRQELPEHAFWEPHEAIRQIQERCSYTRPGKFVFVLSYRWLSREHPDPHRHHLTIIARIVEMVMWDEGDIGIFWDFLSLPQKDDDGIRSRSDEVRFQLGLSWMPIIYTHRLSSVWMQNEMPASFRGPSYEDSGWCFFESTMSSIMKPHDLRLSMSRTSRLEENYDEWCTNCRTSRPPPVTPQKFRVQSGELAFTNSSDSEDVADLFESAFNTLTVNTTELDFSNMLWGTPQAKDLSASLLHFTSCESLDLSNNPFGLHGMLALIPRLADMPNLQVLRLRRCRGLESAQALECLAGTLPKLQRCTCLDLGCNRFGDDGLASLCSSLSAMRLKTIMLDGCGISSAGVDFLTNAGFDLGQLKALGS